MKKSLIGIFSIVTALILASCNNGNSFDNSISQSTESNTIISSSSSHNSAESSSFSSSSLSSSESNSSLISEETPSSQKSAKQSSKESSSVTDFGQISKQSSESSNSERSSSVFSSESSFEQSSSESSSNQSSSESSFEQSSFDSLTSNSSSEISYESSSESSSSDSYEESSSSGLSESSSVFDNVSTYTVTWKNWDGSVLRVDENVEEATIPDYGSTIDDYCFLGSLYTFDYWSPTPSPIHSDISYTAKYAKVTDLSSAVILEKEDSYTYMGIGETHTFKNSFYKTSANKYFIWESSDEKVFTVDENGVVKGLKEGNAYLYLKTSDYYLCDSIKICILDQSSFYIGLLRNNINKLTILMDHPYTLSPSSFLSTFDDYGIIIDDEEIVSLNGFVLTPKKIGSTTMYAKSTLGVISKTVTVSVTQLGSVGLQYFDLYSPYYDSLPSFKISDQSARLCECDFYHSNIYNVPYSVGWKDGYYSISYKVIASIEIVDYEISYYESAAQLIIATISIRITNYDWESNCHYGYSSLSPSFKLYGNLEDESGNILSSSEITISQSDNNNTKIISITGNPNSSNGVLSFFLKSKLNVKS